MRKSFLILVFAAGCGGGSAADGEVVYDNNCARCHGPTGDDAIAQDDANGQPAAALSVEVPELSDDEILDVILNGGDNMPAIAIEDSEAEDVLAYLRKEFGE